MIVSAEANGPQWSTNNDDRITWIGSILRKSRIDELPQLWLVITGVMSLIGPRPERPEMDKNFEKEIDYYEQRYLIRPGLSGWAQVNYPYGASKEDCQKKLSYDIFYIKNFSIWLDLLILFKTLKLVYKRRGSLPNI